MSPGSRNPLFVQLINLLEIICTSGIRALSNEERRLFVTKRSPEVFSKFQMALFESWKKAQEEILVMQLGLYRLVADEKQPFAKYIYQNTQRLMDTIVWHNYGGGDYTDIKRIYDWDPKIQDLSKHNIEMHLRMATEVNKDPRKFALISDLTSGLRLGDLLLFEVGKRPTFAELKEGPINRQIIDYFHNGSQLPNDFYTDQKKIKQVERMARQSKRAHDALKLLHENKGVDDRYPEMEYTIHKIEKPQEKFSAEMEKLIESVEKSGEIQTAVVEDCLLLVALKSIEHGMIPNQPIREEITKFEVNHESSGVSFDWGHILTDSSIMRPLFMQELPPDMIQSLLCREIVVIVYLSFERFCRKFSTEEFSIRSVSGNEKKKMVGRIRSAGGWGVINQKSALVYSHNGKAPEIFSDGIFGRIPSFLVNPSYFLYMQKCTVEVMESLKDRKDEK